MIRLATLFRAAALSATTFLAAGLAPADEPASPSGLESVQGVWTTRDDVEVQSTWKIKGDAFEAVVNGTRYLGKIAVDEKAKPHPTLTIDVKEGPGDVKGKASKGVYKVEGDKLIVNLGAPGSERPSDFDQAGDEVFLFELTKKPGAE